MSIASNNFNTAEHPVNLFDIKQILEPSTIAGVMKLKFATVHVHESKWKECLAEIEEACAVKWIVHKSNRIKKSLIKRNQKKSFSESRKCHRADTYVSKATKRLIQKESKKCDCKAILKIECFTEHPSVFTFSFTYEHTSHIPGDRYTDLRTLPLTRVRLLEIRDRLLACPSLSTRQLRIEVLRDMDRTNRLCERKVNYTDIYNITKQINKMLYAFDKDDMISVNIWLNRKLGPEGFLIFRGNSSNDNLYALGFMSPFQKQRISHAVTFCLDSTHSISKRSDDIMYTILINDEHLGRGFPCGYMFTNDHSIGPISEWLNFLKEEGVIIDPQQIIIDCFNDTKTNAIKNVFPACKIQYCLFHVCQAWKHQIALKIKSGEPPSADSHALGNEILHYLKVILNETDREVFHNLINEFIARYEASQSLFITYFRKEWCNEVKYNLWSKAYHSVQFSHVLTNNYIESWHNQLKSVYLHKSRNKRLDRLFYILNEEVAYFYKEEFDRVEVNHGPMTGSKKEKRRVELAARAIPALRRNEMIKSPSGTSYHEDIDNNIASTIKSGTWTIESFTDENSLYDVIVDGNNKISSCSCYYYRQRLQVCKHMYLLNLQVKEFELISFAREDIISSAPRTTFTSASDSFPIESSSRVSNLIERAIDIQKMLHIGSQEELIHSTTYLKEEEAAALLHKYEESYRELQTLQNNYNSHYSRTTHQI